MFICGLDISSVLENPVKQSRIGTNLIVKIFVLLFSEASGEYFISGILSSTELMICCMAPASQNVQGGVSVLPRDRNLNARPLPYE